MSFRYYMVLGLRENASLNDIKKAYRLKAKKYHPDINKAPDAHEKFIEINEAYEFLINLKTQPRVYSREAMEERYREWVRTEREKARARAAYQAKMRFEQFKKSPLYRTSLRLSNIYDTIVLAMAIFMIFGALNGLWIQKTINKDLTGNAVIAAILLLCLCIILIYFSLRGLRERRKIIRRDFKNK
ncbi:MAG: DnaJ domain-containing protein [Bacteroidales bacterium]|nr:MAG: DnaJ domain-containing protein [Bacteroidales bacterium]